MTAGRPSLIRLHSEDMLVRSKLEQFRAMESEIIVASPLPGLPGSLKAREDGTVMDGNHRVRVLREREFVVDSLPREIV